MNIFHCAGCGRDVYEDEEYYDIDGTCYCFDCAYDWLQQFRATVPVDNGDCCPSIH